MIGAGPTGVQVVIGNVRGGVTAREIFATKASVARGAVAVGGGCRGFASGKLSERV